MKSFIRDERGYAMEQIAAMVIAPIVAVTIALAAISLVRTGGNLTDAFQRSAQATVLSNSLKQSLEGASQVHATDDRSFVSAIDPAMIPPGDILQASDGGACVTFSWEIVRQGEFDVLSTTRDTHKTADCTSPVDGKGPGMELRGFHPGAHFEYANSGGRELLVNGNTVSFGDTARPAKMSIARWESTKISFVTVRGVVNELIGEKSIDVQASTWDANSIATVPERRPDSAEFTLAPDTTITVTPPLKAPYGTFTWSDGDVQNVNGDAPTKTLTGGQIYTVRFEGEFTDLSDALTDPFRTAVTNVTEWFSNTGQMSGKDAFRGMTKLDNVPISVPKLTSGAGLFQGDTLINDSDISGWDVSKATSLSGAFKDATAFNQSLNAWDTSSVTNMSAAFQNATSFNSPISGWDTSLTYTMADMFNGAGAFNQPIGTWNTSRLQDMSRMFNGASAFTQDITSWDTSHVTKR